MRFVIIRPATQRIDVEEHAKIEDAYARAGLAILEMDHGVVAQGLGIVVYEFAMFQPPAKQSYFTINARLYGGNAVLYAFDHKGETTDVNAVPTIRFIPTLKAVERNIALGLVQRPELRINGEVVWQW